MGGWSWFAIAVGGGVGAVARFMVARQMGHWLGTYLPYGTLTVNALGSWMLGFLSVYLLDRPEVSPLIRLGLACLLYTSPSPRDATLSRMPSSA